MAGSSLVLSFSDADPAIFAAIVAALIPLVFAVALPVDSSNTRASTTSTTSTTSITPATGDTRPEHGRLRVEKEEEEEGAEAEADRWLVRRGDLESSPADSAAASGIVLFDVHSVASVNSPLLLPSQASSSPAPTATDVCTHKIPHSDGSGSADGDDVAGVAGVAGVDYTLVRTLRSLDFWLLFTVFLCGIGAGITIVNNMFEIVTSRLGASYNGTTVDASDVPHSKDAATLLILVRCRHLVHACPSSLGKKEGRVDGRHTQTFRPRFPRLPPPP